MATNTKHPSEATFQRYQRQYLEETIKDIKEALFKKLEASFNSGAIPDKWKETGNHLLTKAVVDSFCKDRPYSFHDSRLQKEANNIHLFI